MTTTPIGSPAHQASIEPEMPTPQRKRCGRILTTAWNSSCKPCRWREASTTGRNQVGRGAGITVCLAGSGSRRQRSGGELLKLAQQGSRQPLTRASLEHHHGQAAMLLRRSEPNAP